MRRSYLLVLLTLLLSTGLLRVTLSIGENDNNIDGVNNLVFENPSLRKAYIALQAWKAVIFSDPFNFTTNWAGAAVCSYNGVFCAPSLANSSNRVVAGIDLNHADIAGYLPPELGLFTDLGLFHVNSNRFFGTVPKTFKKLRLLHELDLSNNRFVGPFPRVVLSLPVLKFLDLRFNEFEGSIPVKLFDKDLDAVFLNNNRFKFGIPPNLGNSPVSVLVLANNSLDGLVKSGDTKLKKGLIELFTANNGGGDGAGQ
ncbi:hypothetical protein L1987_29697 [Smallanthus sonchifolius]|uniref:Uncharacterized protein n=1 Tax=Smallanthus sonchifolius TaxID=185202 RepID=A0ACB9I1X2_9ASTR|nr:hypothetical protein L1987_29697 [Smallanthus sonchifolius]